MIARCGRASGTETGAVSRDSGSFAGKWGTEAGNLGTDTGTCGEQAANCLTRAGITVNLDAMTVMADGRQLPITGKDYELLLYLMQNPGRVLSREMILIRIWGYDFEGESRVVDTHIKRLRKSLGEKAGCIRTRVNVGYSFDAEE